MAVGKKRQCIIQAGDKAMAMIKVGQSSRGFGTLEAASIFPKLGARRSIFWFCRISQRRLGLSAYSAPFLVISAFQSVDELRQIQSLKSRRSLRTAAEYAETERPAKKSSTLLKIEKLPVSDMVPTHRVESFVHDEPSSTAQTHHRH